jgi:CDP-glucose 4,6-dehydratase
METVVNMQQAVLSRAFWQGKRVLLTGHTGFKGAWLAIWLHYLGAQTCGFALEAQGDINLFDAAHVKALCQHIPGDIREAIQLKQVIENFKPEVVFHLAAQALVRQSYAQPLQTFDTNVMGTVNLLQAVRECADTRVVIAVTTDKVYRNDEDGCAFVESDSLGGHDPYSASKAAAEMVIESYRRSFFTKAGIGIVSARAGNVIGGGDWSQDRIIPDAIRAWQTGQVLSIRNPVAIRPWQHVVEPLHAYLCAAQRVYEEPELADAYNFGPAPHSCVAVGDLVKLAAQSFDQARVQLNEQPNQPYEAKLLQLNVQKAWQKLGIHPQWDVQTTVKRTMSWYQRFYRERTQALQACIDDIEAFSAEIRCI